MKTIKVRDLKQVLDYVLSTSVDDLVYNFKQSNTELLPLGVTLTERLLNEI